MSQAAVLSVFSFIKQLWSKILLSQMSAKKWKMIQSSLKSLRDNNDKAHLLRSTCHRRERFRHSV